MARCFILCLFFASLVHAQTAGTPSSGTQAPDVPDVCQPGSGVPRPPNTVCPVNYGGGGVSGLIAESTFRSCSQFENELNCGDAGNVTILDIGLNPGTGASVQYEFSVASSPGVGLGAGGSGDCQNTDACTVNTGDVVVVTVTSSPLLVFYDLVTFDLSVPYAYTSHHTNAFAHYDADPPKFCGGATASKKVSTDGSVHNKGIVFSQVCNMFHQRDTHNPDEDSVALWPSAGCCDDSGNSDTCWDTDQTIEQFNDENTTWFPFEDNPTRITNCDMPYFNTAVQTNDGNGHGLLCMYYNTDDYTAAFDGNTSEDRVNDNDDDHSGWCPRGETDDDEDDNGPNQCNNKYRMLWNNSPCRYYHGKYYFQGRVNKNNLNPANHKFAWKNDAKADFGAIFDVQPVLIGCGAGPLVDGAVSPPFFLYGLEPVTFKNNDPTGASGYYGSTRPDNDGNPCGPDDEDCCQGFMTSESDATTIGYMQCHPGITDKALTTCENTPPDLELDTCAACNYDRTGVKTGLGATHFTASAMGKIGPFSNVYEIRPAANPIFQVNATLQKKTSSGLGPVLSMVTVTNVVLEGRSTNQAQNNARNRGFITKQLLGQSEVSQDRKMLLKITSIDSTDGKIGTDLNGFIVVVNQTTDASGNVLIYQGNPSDYGVKNPYEGISNPFTSVTGGKGGLAPWPNHLNIQTISGEVSNPNGVWYYYVPPEKKIHYGKGCSQLGMELDFMRDIFNVDLICSSERNTCVPGTLAGFDWTIQNRIDDVFNTQKQAANGKNPGDEEIKLRDQLDVHTPCVISGYYHQWMQTSESCAQFINSYSKFGYLPPDWVSDNGGDVCDAPNYWIYGNRMFFQDPTLKDSGKYIRVRLAVAGELLDVTQSISSGCFAHSTGTIQNDCLSADSPATINDIQCGAIQNGDEGTINLFVQNTGDLVGDYIVEVNCTQSSGIVVLSAPVVELQPNTPPKKVSVSIKHTGAIPKNATCSARLSHPSFTFVTFSTIDSIQCQVVSAGDVANATSSVSALDVCALYGVDCGAGGREPHSGSWLFIMVLLFVLFLLGGTCLACCLQSEYTKASIENEKAKKAAAADEATVQRYQKELDEERRRILN